MTQTEEPSPPAHRLQIERSDAPVKVSHNGTVLAESTRAIVLREGSLPPRYYLPPDDIRMDLLEPSANTSHCPFKGDATYWSADGAPNVAWSYPTPIEGAGKIAGLIAFYNDRVDLEVGPSTS
jgi:uncharacterized protein (DUF427 family)